VKDITLESFLSNLLFIGIDSEIVMEGVWVKGNKTEMTNVARMMRFNMQQPS
jgi:hypothetical protein